MSRMHMRSLARAVSVAMLAVTAAGGAQAVQRMYQGEMRIGFGDGYKGPGPSPMGMTEPIDTANNAVPPCAAPGVVVTPSGMNNDPRTPMGAGPATGVIQFTGAADVALTSMGAIDPAAPINFLTLTPAGVNRWGLEANCPKYTNGVPGGALFRRTQMATFRWPAAPATMMNNAGAVRTGTELVATQDLKQEIRAVPGPNRFGGSVAALGNGDTLLGFVPLAPGFPFGIGLLPVPLQLGADGGTAMGVTIPTGRVTRGGVIFKATTMLSQRLPNGPVPGPGAPNYPLTAFARGLGFRWTTGVVTAYDDVGDFRTTRTRTGAANFVPAGATSASIQLVTPSVLTLGLNGLPPLGIAVTSELSIKFVPEPASVAMLGAGAGAIGLLLLRQRRAARQQVK